MFKLAVASVIPLEGWWPNTRKLLGSLFLPRSGVQFLCSGSRAHFGHGRVCTSFWLQPSAYRSSVLGPCGRPHVHRPSLRATSVGDDAHTTCLVMAHRSGLCGVSPIMARCRQPNPLRQSPNPREHRHSVCDATRGRRRWKHFSGCRPQQRPNCSAAVGIREVDHRVLVRAIGIAFLLLRRPVAAQHRNDNKRHYICPCHSRPNCSGDIHIDGIQTRCLSRNSEGPL